MHAGHWLTTVARRVIVNARVVARSEGRIGHDQVLVELATHSPETLVEVLTAVAEHVPDDVVARIIATTDPVPVAELIYREAHARYAADDRDDWVRWGESGYHRLAYLRRRDRRGA